MTPDHVAVERRGSTATPAAFGVLLPRGAGAMVGAAFLKQAQAGLLVVPWVLAAASIASVLVAKDRPHTHVPREPPLIAERAWTLAPTPWAALRERLARQTPLWRALGFTWYAGTDIPWAETVPRSGAQ
ncbi:hypothetical protein [Streptomyces sp. NPDC048496]|uniref:hypothetical protein n=1 Tax=Streptomyces sp. NPDC048496 TaxID=3365558 RepID=UPI00371C7AC1